jgi:hypothetical protein
MFIAAGRLERIGAMLPGLIAGLGLGGMILLILGTIGSRVEGWLQGTRLEDQILSVDEIEGMNPSSQAWLELADQAGDWLSQWPSNAPHKLVEESRQFVWEDDLPPIEILVEVER